MAGGRANRYGERRDNGVILCDEHWEEREQPSSPKLRLSEAAMKVLYENQD
jgi:hypothetical protein